MATDTLIRLAITAWLVVIAVHDYRTRRIPAWTTWPVIFALAGWWWLARGAWQVAASLAIILAASSYHGYRLPLDVLVLQALVMFTRPPYPALLVIVVWWALFLAWRYADFGGGDTAMLMALIALFPSFRFTLILLLVSVVFLLPVLIRERKTGERKRYALGPVFALAGILAVWALPTPFHFSFPIS